MKLSSILILVPGTLLVAHVAAAGSSDGKACKAAPPIPTETKTVLQRRKDTVTVTSTQKETVFETLVVTTTIFTITSVQVLVPTTITNIVSLTESFTTTDISVSISSSPTQTQTTTGTRTVISTVAGPTVTTTPAPKPQKWSQHPGFYIAITFISTLVLALWPIILIGMFVQRRRTRRIINNQHQLNPNDIPLEDLAPKVDDGKQ